MDLESDYGHLVERFRGDVPAALVYAVIQKESSGNAWAVRYEPNYRWLFDVDRFVERNRISRSTEAMQQKTSWGLMQIMGAVARELGFDGCYLSLLCDPGVGILYGCKLLMKHWNTFGGNVEEVLIAYNGGERAVYTYGGLLGPAREAFPVYRDYVLPVLAMMQEMEKEIVDNA